MAIPPQPFNRVRERRSARGWSQAELAERAGISRTAVSAIEAERLVPSVAAALGLSRVLECSVEELFGTGHSRATKTASPTWAWPPAQTPCRYWLANVDGRRRLYPVEETPLGEIPHDGVHATGQHSANERLTDNTLVMASCDPAAGLLARVYEQITGYRLIVFPRSSRQALQLLQQGLVHVSGVHLNAADDDSGNASAVREIVAEPATLLHVVTWEDGIAVGSDVTASTVRGLLRNPLTWVGREAGSGARQCLDELLDHRPAPRRLARDHRGVAEAVRCGWADAGVCLKLVADEAGLRFLSVRTERYDLCYLRRHDHDPRIQALVRVIQSSEYRRQMSELPGYDARRAGDLVTIAKM
ncbi:MAG: helix-turn-helix domain-containing protein [Planctomycetaceae bacterium]|nr:helix-turn-helix domain-containing protein [Planctomycetaceae bacterium]